MRNNYEAREENNKSERKMEDAHVEQFEIKTKSIQNMPKAKIGKICFRLGTIFGITIGSCISSILILLSLR